MNFLRLIAIVASITVSVGLSSIATAQSSPTITITNISPQQISKAQAVSFADALIVYFDHVGANLPNSRQYIALQYPNVTPGTKLYQSLQKGVMMGLIGNVNARIPRHTKIQQDLFARLVQTHLGVKLGDSPDVWLDRETLVSWTSQLPDYYTVAADRLDDERQSIKWPITDISNFELLNDAYLTIKQQHINGASLIPEDLIQGAIRGLAESTNDKHTTYFPPAESQQFGQEINGEVEGIGAYIEMQQAGMLMIVTPLEGSPAQKAGLQPGDKILQVGDLVIDESVDLQTAIGHIKGPAGTTVTLSIQRGTQKLSYTITRAKVTIQGITHKLLDNGDAYIQMRQFSIGIIKEWNKTIEWLTQQTSVNKIIIDLRNNPGGSLQDVVDMLSSIVPKGLPIVHIGYHSYEEPINSAGLISYPRDTKKIIILTNRGSASASEIMAGVIKEYLPNTILLGEKTYGKGSVQTVYEYPDLSSLKLTIAKRYTGKDHINIDGTGIKVDIEVLPITGDSLNGIDRQLDAAKKIP